MKFLVFISGIIFFHSPLLSAVMVFDLRKSFPLTATEQPLTDYYLSAGKNEGLRPGYFLSVYREKSVHNSFENEQQDILRIPIAIVRIIHVEEQMSVARLESIIPEEERPVTELDGILIGDRVDLASLRVDY